MSTKDAYDMRARYRPRFFVRVGHETTSRKVASNNTSCLEAHPCNFTICMEISIFSMYHVIDRLTKIMSRADKKWAHF